MNVAWIGLGSMGLPMAVRLARAGHVVAAYDKNPRIEAPQDVRMRIATSPADATDAADAVIIMVATPDQVRTVVDGPDGVASKLRRGSILMVTATVGPALMTALDSELTPRGVLVVDAAVSGGVARAAEGQLLIIAAGREAAVEGVRPILDALAETCRIVGAVPGDAQRMKLVNQLLCGVHIVAAAEALAYAARIGIDPKMALEVVSLGAAGSFMLSDRGPRMLDEPESAKSAVDIFVKDLGLVLAETRDAGANPLAAVALARFQEAHDFGLGRRDDSAVIKTYLPRSAPS